MMGQKISFYGEIWKIIWKLFLLQALLFTFVLLDNTEECGMLQKFCTRNCTHYTKLQKDICTCETGYRLADDGFTCEGE